jgi:MYXO-CTERM domain-containing protein
MFGFGPRVLAQASSNAWNETLSFTGSGALPVSESSYGQYSGAPADPILSITLEGTGLNTAVSDGHGGYNISSSFQTTVQNITMPNTIPPGASPFSVTAPSSGPDPGLTLVAPLNDIDSAGGPPFYGLYPPPSGTDYSDTIATTVTESFQYGSAILFVSFKGEADLILGPTDSETLGAGGVYTDTYTDSELLLTARIGENDPTVDFNGTVTITTTATSAPDSSPGLVGILALLGVCAIGGWQKRPQAA